MQLLSPRQCNLVSISLVLEVTCILREAGKVQCDSDKIAVPGKS